VTDSHIRQRYRNEPKIQTATDSIVHCLESGMLTTHEVAEVAVLAAQLYAERHLAPVMIRLEGEGIL